MKLYENALQPVKKAVVVSVTMFLLTLTAHAQPPANDNFANAQVLSGDPISVTNNNNNATIETGEPAATGYNTLWYSWTAPATGEASITLQGSGNFTQVLTVWMGGSVANLSLVVSGYPVTFPVAKGTLYYICAGSAKPTDQFGGETGIIQVNISLNTSSSIDSLPIEGPATTIANDNFDNRIVTSTEFGSYIAYNNSASRETLEPTPGYNTLWWTYHAPATGMLDINSAGDQNWTFSKYISVYYGTAVQNLEILTPSVTGSDCYLPVVQSNDYQICVSSVNSPNQFGGETGPIVLTFSLTADANLDSYNLNGGATFTNDNFSSATVLTGASPAVVSYNAYAAREVFEPANDGYNTIWFKWTAPAAGMTQVLTQGSDAFATYVTVYTGSSINALTQVTRSAGVVNATATFNAIAGQTYCISIGSVNPATQFGNPSGSIVLGIFGQSGTPTGPALTIARAVELEFPTVTNTTYRVQESADLQTWNTLTNVITGNGFNQQVLVVPQSTTEMYRVTAQ